MFQTNFTFEGFLGHVNIFVMFFGSCQAGKCLAAIKAIDSSNFIEFDNLPLILFIFSILYHSRQHVSKFHVFFHAILSRKILTAYSAIEPLIKMQLFVM